MVACGREGGGKACYNIAHWMSWSLSVASNVCRGDHRGASGAKEDMPHWEYVILFECLPIINR